MLLLCYGSLSSFDLFHSKHAFTAYMLYRAMKFLPVNIDPIPEEIRQDFGLPSLYDVSVLAASCF